MFFDPIKLALAATIVKAAKFTICALGLTYYPRLFSKIHAYSFHGMDTKMSLHGFFMGLVQVVLHTFILVWAFAYLYNYLLMQ